MAGRTSGPQSTPEARFAAAEKLIDVIEDLNKVLAYDNKFTIFTTRERNGIEKSKALLTESYNSFIH